MNQQTKSLALAILKSEGGSSGKTKLLKLLYLADIEYFRAHRQTLTGFNWVFYHYGPWAADYDSFLQELEQGGDISREAWAGDQREGERIRGLRDASFILLGIDQQVAGRIANSVSWWADRTLPELLDYVYFDTQPMEGAEKRQPLHFDNVSTEPPERYQRTRSGTSHGELARIRRGVAMRRAAAPAATATAYLQAPHDDIYAAAIAALDSPEAD